MLAVRIYVDTNIFIDFYQSAHDRVGVFEELLARADRLILTEQTLNEFERNRANVLSALIEQFKKSTKVKPHTTSIVQALPEWEPLIEARDQFEQQADRARESLEKFLAQPSADPVYTKFLEVVGAKGVVVLPTTDLLVARAQRRKILGNPPNSPDKITVGDELIWEALLEGVRTIWSLCRATALLVVTRRS